MVDIASKIPLRVPEDVPAGLGSAWLKRTHAANLHKDLEHRLSRWLSGHQPEYHQRFEPDTNDIVIYATIPEIDPALQLLVGDFVHNLRSALDHLANALVEHRGGTVTTSTAWPIRSGPDTKKDWRLSVKGVTPEDLAYIESTRLNVADEYILGAPLALLHHLDILDKHRLLLAHLGGVFPLLPFRHPTAGIDMKVGIYPDWVKPRTPADLTNNRVRVAAGIDVEAVGLSEVMIKWAPASEVARIPITPSGPNPQLQLLELPLLFPCFGSSDHPTDLARLSFIMVQVDLVYQAVLNRW
jgi:hypothetical protein